MKELIVMLDPYEIGDNLNELAPAVNILSRTMKENPALASIEVSKILHLTMKDLVNIISKDVNNIVYMVANGKTRDY